jgi:hypothetical protein
MRLPEIIGFAGKAGAGKTTAAKTLAWGHGYTIGSFAYRMKLAISDMFDIPFEILTADASVKAQMDDRHGLSYRRILQKFGDCTREKFGADIWVKIFWEVNKGILPLAIDDVRFDREALSIIERGGIIVDVTRPGLISTDSHSSEAGLSENLITHRVVNNGSDVNKLYGDIIKMIRR